MKFRLSSEFGELSEVRNYRPHSGIDFAMGEGTTLRSIAEGVVTDVFDGTKAIGKGVAIRTEDGTTHIFGHMKSVSVKLNEHIEPGEIIGMSGSTGNSTGPHLHFSTQLADGKFADPTPLAEKVANMSGDVDKGSWFMDKYNQFSDWLIGKEMDLVIKPAQHTLHDILISCWDWFVFNLPDIMGYTTIGAGIFIILGSMIGKGGMMKPLGWYTGALILATCILGGK